MKKKPKETFQEYAQRWKEKAAEVIPPMDSRELVKTFIQTTEKPFYGELIKMINSPFADVVEHAETIEDACNSGKMVDLTALQAVAEHIQSGNYPKKNSGKKEEDMSLILPVSEIRRDRLHSAQ